MATFLDVTSLQHFTSLFVFLFVLVVVYAVMQGFNAFGGNKVVYVVVAFLMAIFVVMSNLAVSVVASTAPFLAIVFLFVVFLSIAMKMLGSEPEAFQSIKVVFLVLIILIVFVSAAVKVRDSVNVPNTPQDMSKSINVIFHPTFIGMVLLFAVAVFTIALLAKGGH